MTGCPQSAPKTEPRGKAYFTYFDTVSNIYSYAGDSQEEFDARTAEAVRILDEYHKLFDIYYEHSGINNLCTVNKNAGGEPLKVDQKLIDFLLYAKELYELTGGEMNVMMGALLRPWHDCRTAASDNPAGATIPDAATLEEAAKHTSIDLLEIDRENLTVRISDPAASIDVGALGKGYATEKAAQHLESLGVTSYVLNIGGNIRIIGSKTDGSGWLTGIKDPMDSDNSYAEYITLKDTSCVTSGIYERFYTVGGVQYHHIIDKDTLMPSAFFASISIITKDSGLADALSTALFCMSYEDGKAIVDKLSGVEVLWITHEGEKLMTDGFKALVTERN
jgi:thiamine biosynthesis lipoprotein